MRVHETGHVEHAFSCDQFCPFGGHPVADVNDPATIGSAGTMVWDGFGLLLWLSTGPDRAAADKLHGRAVAATAVSSGPTPASSLAPRPRALASGPARTSASIISAPASPPSTSGIGLAGPSRRARPA